MAWSQGSRGCILMVKGVLQSGRLTRHVQIWLQRDKCGEEPQLELLQCQHNRKTEKNSSN